MRTLGGAGVEKSLKLAEHASRQIAGDFLEQKVMGGAIDVQEPVRGRNESQSCVHLVGRAEGVARAVDEEAWGAQLGKVGSAELGGFLRRVKRIGEEQEAVGDLRIFGKEHGGLAAAVGMAAEKNAAADLLFDERDGAAQAAAVALGIATRRAKAAVNTKGQIEAEHRETGSGESVGDCEEQFRLAIGAGAVSEEECFTVRIGRKVEKATHRRISVAGKG